MFISHGDCLEDAQYVASLIRAGLPKVKEIEYLILGTIVGAHAGPGTVAVFFLADNR